MPRFILSLQRGWTVKVCVSVVLAACVVAAEGRVLASETPVVPTTTPSPEPTPTAVIPTVTLTPSLTATPSLTPTAALTMTPTTTVTTPEVTATQIPVETAFPSATVNLTLTPAPTEQTPRPPPDVFELPLAGFDDISAWRIIPRAGAPEDDGVQCPETGCAFVFVGGVEEDTRLRQTITLAPDWVMSSDSLRVCVAYSTAILAPAFELRVALVDEQPSVVVALADDQFSQTTSSGELAYRTLCSAPHVVGEPAGDNLLVQARFRDETGEFWLSDMRVIRIRPLPPVEIPTLTATDPLLPRGTVEPLPTPVGNTGG